MLIYYPHPFKNNYVSPAFSSQCIICNIVHAVNDFIQTVTNKILFDTVSTIQVSFKMMIHCDTNKLLLYMSYYTAMCKVKKKERVSLTSKI